MRVSELFEAQEASAEGVTRLFSIVKKIAPKSYSSVGKLQDALKGNIAYHVGKYSGSNTPPGKVVFVDWFDQGGNPEYCSAYEEGKLTKAGTSVEELSTLLKNLGAKHVRKLTKWFD